MRGLGMQNLGLSHEAVVRPPISDTEKDVFSLPSVPSRPCWAFYRRPRGRATRPFRGGSSCCCGLMLRSHDISSTKLIGQGNAAACRPRTFCQQLLPLNYADWQIYSRHARDSCSLRLHGCPALIKAGKGTATTTAAASSTFLHRECSG